jgi:hypothetical protein
MTGARRSRNQNSEYLAQRRKGRKEIKLPDLAFLASWREKSPSKCEVAHAIKATATMQSE